MGKTFCSLVSNGLCGSDDRGVVYESIVCRNIEFPGNIINGGIERR